jgi:hypothetical protein
MRIVFCLPGSNFSNIFLTCWSDMLLYCVTHGIVPIISQAQSNNIYYVRQMCLGADVSRGKDQKPFNGQLEYDYIMWIDSDQIFKPDQLQTLINRNKDIVGGIYAHEGGQGFACGKIDLEFYKTNGYMEYYTPDSIKEIEKIEDNLMEVDFTGFGFLLIKNGVYEKLEYPWHRPEWFEIGDNYDFTMEDVGFCINAKKAGFNIYVDPCVRVGHVKKAIY